jgi:hypothetical protein
LRMVHCVGGEGGGDGDGLEGVDYCHCEDGVPCGMDKLKVR